MSVCPYVRMSVRMAVRMSVCPLTIMRYHRKRLKIARKQCDCILIHYGRIYLPARACYLLFLSDLHLDVVCSPSPKCTTFFRSGCNRICNLCRILLKWDLECIARDNTAFRHKIYVFPYNCEGKKPVKITNHIPHSLTSFNYAT